MFVVISGFEILSNLISILSLSFSSFFFRGREHKQGRRAGDGREKEREGES